MENAGQDAVTWLSTRRPGLGTPSAEAWLADAVRLASS